HRLGCGHDERDDARHRAAHPCRPIRAAWDRQHSEGRNSGTGSGSRHARSARQHQGPARLWGASVIGLKSYQRGRESFQGETLDYLWCDEEPPADIFTEGLTRTNVNQGPVWVTFTPLLGMSEVVRRFLLEPSPGRSVTTMTLDDVAHYTDEEKEQIAA